MSVGLDQLKCFSSQISVNFIFKNFRIQFLYTVWQQVIKKYPIIVYFIHISGSITVDITVGSILAQVSIGQELGVSQATVSRTVDRAVNSIVAQSNKWIRAFPTAIGVIDLHDSRI
ncbi:unnamed protein product [Acanthoscelides obtectus]|uniref:Uncharacterized protein n=1 Tax=Acanthoscelides obtectus TaxID=200917 RepID=A0A9P0P3N0_ACAOB|nr:unnamed protein product [Acanthoscelides obtectus]CAK1673469.1 hypothetical protein AOBTE_LOCUS29349 [Acanthoscelides obtectus]